MDKDDDNDNDNDDGVGRRENGHIPFIFTLIVTLSYSAFAYFLFQPF